MDLSIKLDLRRATHEDGEFLLALRNDPVVRENSFNQDEVTEEEHWTWLTDVLRDGSRKLYIILANDEPAGQVRFDREGDRAEISISLSEKLRGAHLSHFIIQKACDKYSKETRMSRIFARIKPENIASIKAFEKAGFEKVGEEWVL